MLNGRFENFQNDSVDVIFNFFGLEKKIKLSTLYENDKLQLKGSVNLIKQLGLDKAYESISNKCYDLHKGLTGFQKHGKKWKFMLKLQLFLLVIRLNYYTLSKLYFLVYLELQNNFCLTYLNPEFL